MRVLMLGWEFPPDVKGGLAMACFGITQALLKQGTDVLFVLPRYSGGAQTASKKLAIVSACDEIMPEVLSQEHQTRIKQLWQAHFDIRPIESLLFPYATQETYQEYLQNICQSQQEHFAQQLITSHQYELTGDYGVNLMSEVFRYSQLVANLAQRENFDVVHAHDWMTYPAAMLIKMLTGKPIVVHVHATEYDRSGMHVNQEVAAIEKKGMEFADKVVVVSHYTKNLVIREYGIDASKIEVVHNAVSRRQVEVYNKEPKDTSEKRVLFMGRVTFQKGPEYFVEAAHLVLQQIPNVRFILAGSGDMLTRMVRRVAQLRMGSRVHFTGFLHGEDVDKMYALSDLYVMPSVSEPFGIAPLEAMLYDVPVIISRQSGVSEVVKNALKVDFWDVQEMANKICAVLTYPVLGNFMVSNCREELKEIKWENAAKQLCNVYASLGCK